MGVEKLSHEVEGQVLGHTIYDEMGQVLLRRGVVLTESYIRRLQSRGYMSVHIQNQLAPEIEVEDAIDAQTRAQAVQTIESFSRSMAQARAPDVEQVTEVVDTILDQLLIDSEVVLNLNSIKTIDSYTFEHSVNVCVLSLILGRHLTSKRSELKELGAAALLHDIGKLSIPLEILLKPGPLTEGEYAIVKNHSMAGYNMLKELFFDSWIPTIALEHHERLDGTGYPRGLTRGTLSRWGQVVGMVDVYDAVTSDRIYRTKKRPHEGMMLLRRLSDQEFDSELVGLLSHSIAHYPVGSILVLSNGKVGVVSRQDERAADRPIVRVVATQSGEVFRHTYDRSLAEHPEMAIIEVLDDYPPMVKLELSLRYQR